jgi:hypothetical protein
VESGKIFKTQPGLSAWESGVVYHRAMPPQVPLALNPGYSRRPALLNHGYRH